MKFRRVLTLMLVLGSTRAWAGDLSVGIGLGPLMDLAPTDKEDTNDVEGVPSSCTEGSGYNCGVSSLVNIGGSLRVPFRYAITPNSAFRFGPRFDYGGRRGRVSYDCIDDVTIPLGECDRQPGSPSSIYAKDHFAFTAVGMLALGPEFSVPIGESSIYFAAEVGVGVAYSFDSLEPVPNDAGTLDGQTSPSDGTLAQCAGYDPEAGIDCPEPSSTQPVIGAEAIVGWRGAGSSPFFVEAGFSSTRIPSSSPTDDNILSTERTKYMWNPVRITAGLQFAL